MSVNRVEAYTVSCSTPDCESETGLHWHQDDAKDEARADGWQEKNNGDWICPECLEDAAADGG